MITKFWKWFCKAFQGTPGVGVNPYGVVIVDTESYIVEDIPFFNFTSSGRAQRITLGNRDTLSPHPTIPLRMMLVRSNFSTYTVQREYIALPMPLDRMKWAPMDRARWEGYHVVLVAVTPPCNDDLKYYVYELCEVTQ